MFLRSLIVSVSLVALVAGSAQAGWFSNDKSRTEESKQAQQRAAGKSAQSGPAGAYRAAMRTMHRDMKKPLSGNADVDFARQMIAHHQGAVAMAKIQQKYGRDESLKGFNDWVIQAQTAEIAMMQNWLRRKDNGLSSKTAEDFYGAAMKRMHHSMMIRYTGNADVDYARGMIAHHQGAVDMAAVLLAEGADPELNELANDVYSSQTAEIAWLECWLKEHGQPMTNPTGKHATKHSKHH